MPRKPVGNTFLSRQPAQSLFNDLGPRGTKCPIDELKLADGTPQVYYEHPNGSLILGDACRWLASLEPESVDLVFADPPYNLGKADWDHFSSHDAYIEWSLQWLELASRALRSTGSLYVCGFSEVLADMRRGAAAFFDKCKWIVWFYKNKANLSNDWGRSHESILHYRKKHRFRLRVDDVRIPYGNHTLKYPVHPQAESSQYGNGKARSEHWHPHPGGAKPKDVLEIPVTSNGMKEKTPHPTQKPEELLRRLILAASDEGDLVIDPFSGSGTTLVCAEQLNRKWAGCDLDAEYCSWAVVRLEDVPVRRIDEWMELDRTTARRRESIR